MTKTVFNNKEADKEKIFYLGAINSDYIFGWDKCKQHFWTAMKTNNSQ
jgi:hypothetical protein